MKILHIVNKSVDKSVSDIINSQEMDNEVKVIKLDSSELSYDNVIDEIENADKVISWVAKS